MAPVADQPGDPHRPGSQPGADPAAAVTIHVATTVVPGPDGSPWVQLQIASALTVFAVNVPADLALQMATVVPAKLLQAVDAAKRQAMGLIVPGPVNGHPSGGPKLVLP